MALSTISGYENVEVFEFVKSGNRMTVPEEYEYPEQLYNIMNACWYFHPDSRPEFRTISSSLEEFYIANERQHRSPRELGLVI